MAFDGVHLCRISKPYRENIALVRREVYDEMMMMRLRHGAVLSRVFGLIAWLGGLVARFVKVVLSPWAIFALAICWRIKVEAGLRRHITSEPFGIFGISMILKLSENPDDFFLLVEESDRWPDLT
jgi:hypothetical protein